MAVTINSVSLPRLPSILSRMIYLKVQYILHKTVARFNKLKFMEERKASSKKKAILDFLSSHDNIYII